MRQLLPGTAAARGCALGQARVRLPHALDVEETKIAADAVESELQRFHTAVTTVRAEMRELRDRLHGALAHEVGEFIDLHAMLLDDPVTIRPTTHCACNATAWRRCLKAWTMPTCVAASTTSTK